MNEFIVYTLLIFLIVLTAIYIYAAGVKMGKDIAQRKETRATPVKNFLNNIVRPPAAAEKDERFETLLNNIENYNGTSQGQKKIK